jgi:hypothetical protein
MLYPHLDSKIIEGVEPECCIGDTLKVRAQSIPKFTDLGPPDLCVIEVEEQKKSKFLKKVQSIPGTKRAYYHFVVGVDPSSSACVAAYITDCINEHNNKRSVIAKNTSKGVKEQGTTPSAQESEKKSGGVLTGFLKKRKEENEKKD